MSARTIESIRVDALIPYARNPRTHSEEQVAQIAASIREFGWTNPVLIDEQSSVIAGHGRLSAARKLGLAEVPAIRLSGLTEAQKRALVIADNKLAMNAGWDEELLRLELEELQSLGFDLDLTGFSSLELGKLGATGEDVTEDEIPEPPENPITEKGDLWILGDHRLICGDSTDSGTIALACEGRMAKLLHTDPPYGVSYVSTKNGIPRSGFRNATAEWGEIENDDLQGEKLQAFLESVFRACLPNLDRPAFYLWHAQIGGQQDPTAAAMASIGALIHRVIIWVKPGFVLTRSGQYHWAHEPCFYGWLKGQPPEWLGDKSQRSVWGVSRDGTKKHPTQKPVELFAVPLRNHLRRGDLCLDPFVGSGSQVIAAEQLERRCAAIEFEPRYCDVVVQRWEALTGGSADRRR